MNDNLYTNLCNLSTCSYYFEPLYAQTNVTTINYDELICRNDNKINNVESDLNDKFSHLLSENEELRKEIKDLKKCLAYLNTRVNNLIAEKQIKENE
jgi:hypothetical protein